MSSDWSFGSRSHPCSQSRKISIGIMVGSSTMKGSECSRKYETEGTALPKVNSKLGNSSQTKLQQEEGSPRVTPRSNRKNLLTSDGDSKLKGYRRSKDKIRSKLDYSKGPTPDETIKFFPHNASIFTSKGTGEKRPDGQNKNGAIKLNTDVMEKSFSALDQGVFTADEVPARDKIGITENKQSESLRMKLCELMGNVFSPEKDQNRLSPMDVGIPSHKPEPNINQANNVSLQHKPNSDTIETDSENPGGSKRRPGSRSTTRKRTQKKAPLKKTGRACQSTRKDKQKESNVNLFSEGCKVAQSSVRRKSSSALKQKTSIPTTSSKNKETERKFSWTESRRISFPLEEHEDRIQEEANMKENPISAERSSARGVRPQNSSSLTLEKVSRKERLGEVVKQKDTVDQLLKRNLDGCMKKLTETVAHGNHTGNTSALKISADHLSYLVRPTKERRTLLISSSPGSSRKEDQTKQGKPSVAEAMFNLESMFTFGNFIPIDAHTKPGEHPDIGNDDSNSQDSTASDSESSEGGEMDNSRKDPGEEETLSPEGVTIKIPNSVLHRPKRLRSLRDTKPYVHQPVSHSSKGKGRKTTAAKQDSGEFQVQNEFSRAIGPLAVSLEKMKSKVKLVTANKSSEILNSLATKIEAQMQTVESQVKSDMGKLNNFSKQKRKFLEREFQDQEKQLKSIHERFKKELSQHVQHCMEAAEGLEENKIELKKILEKQKVSHRKLLMQVEQAAQTEIQDAEKRIANMNKLAREQMLQLRLLIEQYLGEGVLC